MKSVPLKTGGFSVSRIGLGTWAIGGGGWKFGWGPQDDRVSIAAIRRALERGVNWIDTAPLYGLGHAEEVVRRALKGQTIRPSIATKCGLVWDARRKLSHALARTSIRQEAEASLRRLGRDRIDLYQIHWPSPEHALEEAWEAMASLVQEGKIRSAGLCNFTAQQMASLPQSLSAVSLQVPASMLSMRAVENCRSFCSERGIAVIAYGVLEKGLLSGSFSAGRVDGLPMDDHRKRDPAFAGPRFSASLQFVEKLKSIALQAGMTPAQAALAWVLQNPDVDSVLIGARTPAQVDELLDAADKPLQPELRNALSACTAEYQNR